MRLQIWRRGCSEKAATELADTELTEIEFAETEFFRGMIELQYGRDAENKLRKIAPRVPWARGWPDDKKAFWNAEAYMWGRKIEKSVREIIAEELIFLKKSRNLDLGCGAYSYLPSVGFDLSPQMLKLNGQCHEKVQGDVEKKLPFGEGQFDSVTAVFLLNYVRDFGELFREVRRVLKPGGNFVMVLYSGKISGWQRRKQVSDFPPQKWAALLRQAGFKVQWHEREGLRFWKGSAEGFSDEKLLN